MSTLSVINLQSQSTTAPVVFQTSTGTEIGQLCRAWVNFDGTTSPGTIRASFNVSSVTKNGTGDYTVNFTTALADTNYCVQRTISGSANYGQYDEGGAPNTAFGLTTTSVRVGGGRDSAGSRRDSAQIHVAIFR